MDIRNFISPQNLAVLQKAGMHKVAGALNGVEEMTIKEGIALIAAKFHIKRAEARDISAGLASLEALRTEKTAEMPWMPLLAKALPGAALGGLGAYIASPDEDPNDPRSHDKMMRNVAYSALAGGGLGLLNTLRRIGKINPVAGQQIGAAIPYLN